MGFQVWSLADDRVTLESTEKTSDVHFSPDGRWLVANGTTTRLWNLENGQRRETDPPQAVESLFSVDSESVIYFDAQGIGRWDLRTERSERLFTLGGIDYMHPFRQDRLLLVLGQELDLLNLATLRIDRIEPWSGGTFGVTQQDLVIIGEGGAVRVLEVASGDVAMVQAADEQVTALRARPDRFVTAAPDGYLRVWRPPHKVPADPEALRAWLEQATSVTIADVPPTTVP